MNWLVYLIFGVLYLGVTFFGLGPVLLADGSTEERIITLVIVIFIYVLITALLLYWRKKRK